MEGRVSPSPFVPSDAPNPSHGCHFFFLLGAWVSAEAAALLAALDDLGSRRTFAAFEAAFLPVCSFLPTVRFSRDTGAVHR